jgi:hypothetical protein
MASVGTPGGRWSRWRWQLRGAAMWPAFALCVVADIALLRELPPAGAGTGLADAFLLGGFLNLVIVAVIAPLAAPLLRRRRPDLPRVVARDYAGTALLLAGAGVLLLLGVAHRPAVADARRAFQAQSDAMRLYVTTQAPPAYRRNVSRADSVLVDRALYRTCVPGSDPEQALCLYIDTSQSPPGVRLDPDRAPNWRLFDRRIASSPPN